MWPFKRKNVYVEVEVIEPKKLNLTPFIRLEIKQLINQNLSITSTLMAIYNMLRRYRELGYEIDVRH